MDASQSKQELKEATDKRPMLLNAFRRLKNGGQLSLEQAQAVQNILEKTVAHRLRHTGRRQRHARWGAERTEGGGVK